MLMESLAFFSFFSVNTVPYRQHLRWVKETNYCMFHSIKLLKMSCGKRCKWHFRDPKLKNLGGGHAPRSPKFCRLRRYNVFSPHAYTFKISLYAPETILNKFKFVGHKYYSKDKINLFWRRSLIKK